MLDCAQQDEFCLYEKVNLLLGAGVTFNRRFTLDYTLLQEVNAWDGKDFVVQALTIGYKLQ